MRQADRRSIGVLPAASRRLSNDGEQVFFGQDEQLLVIEFEVGAGIFGEEHLIADLHIEGDALAVIIAFALPDGEDGVVVGYSEGAVVAAGLLTDVLTAENLSKAFGQSIALDVIDGRYFARRIRSRAAAYKALDEIADYLLRTEPHSPTGYLVKRAVRWGELPLQQLLTELVPDERGLTAIYTLLGLAKRADGK